MIVSSATHQQSTHRGASFQFLVHVLKITRLPSHVPDCNAGCSPHRNAKTDALKVTALYNDKQVIIGEFPIVISECVIDRKLTCQFHISKSDSQPKLHFYIDEAVSSGLVGHLALDLKEYIREDETEVYVKYPLHANTLRDCRGPMLKMIIQNLGKGDFEASFEENEIILLKHQSIERLHSKRISNSEDSSSTFQNLDVDSHIDLSTRMQPRRMDEALLMQLEGALSDIDEKLKLLVSTFKGKNGSRTGWNGEVECQSSTTSPLLSSLHTETSMDSHSEMYEEQCTDSDDVFDLSQDLCSSVYPLSMSKHSRALSDISSLTSNQRYPRVLRHGRNLSTEENFSESWFTQSNMSSGEDGNGHNYGCYKHGHHDECFMCSSTEALKSFEGIQSSLSRSKSLSMPPKFLPFRDSRSASAGLPALPHEESSNKDTAAEAPAARKGPGLLKSLFGAVVFAGVSLLGARNSSLLKDRPQSAAVHSKVGNTSRISFSSDIRSERSSKHRYSFRH